MSQAISAFLGNTLYTFHKDSYDLTAQSGPLTHNIGFWIQDELDSLNVEKIVLSIEAGKLLIGDDQKAFKYDPTISAWERIR